MKNTALLLALLLTACAVGEKVEYQDIALVSPNRQIIELAVEVADTPEERAQGLMGRTHLKENTGMLFLFQKPEVLKFWMKDTLIPLDILFFDGAATLVSHITMEPCTKDPCSLYSSTLPAAIAVEVNAGFAKKHGIGPGWRIALKQQE